MAHIQVVKAAQASIETPVEIQLSLGNPTYRGPAGPAGPGFAPGGTVDQFLTKASSADYDTKWTDLPPMVNHINGKTGEVLLNAADVGALSDDTFIPDVQTLTNSDILAIWNTL